MITFLTTAKSFLGAARTRQLNAIGSWRRIDPDVQILLFGTGEGYADVVREAGLEWVPNVPSSANGCPRADSMFAMAEPLARHAVKALVNCDIILTSDVVSATERITLPRYVIVAQRWDVRVDRPIEFTHEWEGRVRTLAHTHGSRMGPSGIDMFLYRGSVWSDLPELVVGRAGYDNYLVFHCRTRGIPVIDATDVLTPVHQVHSYSHLAGGKEEAFLGEDAQQNIRAAGGLDYLFTIQDADWRLSHSGLRRNRCRGDWRRYALTNRLVNGRWIGRKSMSPRSVLRDALCELYLRTSSRRGRRLLELTKFPLWVALRAMGRK